MTKEDVQNVVNVVIDVHMSQASEQIFDLCRSSGDVSPEAFVAINKAVDTVKHLLAQEISINLKLYSR